MPAEQSRNRPLKVGCSSEVERVAVERSGPHGDDGRSAGVRLDLGR